MKRYRMGHWRVVDPETPQNGTENPEDISWITIPGETARKAVIGVLTQRFRFAKTVGDHKNHRFRSWPEGFHIVFKHPKYEVFYEFTLPFEGILYATLFDYCLGTPNGRAYGHPEQQALFDEMRVRWKIPVDSFMEIDDEGEAEENADRIQVEVEKRIISFIAGDRNGWVMYRPKNPLDDEDEEESEDY